MYGVELYAAVRLAVVDEGLSHHEAGRRFGIDRRTVKKMLSYSAPPGYRRTKPVRRPKLDGFTGIVDAILEADTDPDVPRKQRLDLPRFGGHLISWEKGVHDADDTSTLFIRFPGADGRAGSIGPLAGGAGSGVRAFRSVDP